jgi:hypothetical protein
MSVRHKASPLGAAAGMAELKASGSFVAARELTASGW